MGDTVSDYISELCKDAKSPREKRECIKKYNMIVSKWLKGWVDAMFE